MELLGIWGPVHIDCVRSPMSPDADVCFTKGIYLIGIGDLCLSYLNSNEYLPT